MMSITFGETSENWALDEKQKQEVKEISNRVMKEMIKKRTDEQITGIEMKELLDKDPVHLKAVEIKSNKWRPQSLKSNSH